MAIACLAFVGGERLGAESDPYAAWARKLTPRAAVPFPAIAPFLATYRFGWEGLEAGGAEVKVEQGSDPGRRRITVNGGPNSLIRTLWNYRALYVGEADADGLVPSWFHMDEEGGKRILVSEALFNEGSVYACHRLLSEEKPWRFTALPGVRDLFAAMLFVRSQPLHDGDRLCLCVFPDQGPYLVDLVVAGRETLMILGKKTPSIRFTIGIQAIETRGPSIGRLTPHKKFRSGRVWMSDDLRRIPLRAEVDVFVGAVFAELSKATPPL